MRAPDPDGAGSGNYTPPPRLGHINIGYLDADPIGANDGDLYYNVNSKGLRVYDWDDAAWKQISSVRIVGAAPYGNAIYYQGQFAWNTAEQTLYVANSTTANAGPTGYWDWRPAVNLSSYAPLSSPIFEGNPQFGVANNVTVDFGVGAKSATLNMTGTLNIANYSNITFAYASPGIYFKNGNATPGSTKLTYSYSGASNIVLNLPSVGGNLVGTGDTGTVTNTMLANSSITINGTAVSLGGSITVSGLGANTFTGTQTIAPSGSGTSVAVRQAATGTSDIFTVTNAAGSSTYFYVNTGGNAVANNSFYTNTVANISSGNNASLILGSGGLTAQTAIAGNIPLIVNNTQTPTADLMQWKGAGSVWRSISSKGREYGTSTIYNGIDMHSETGNFLTETALPNDVWSDKIRGRIGYYETSTNGTTWTWGTFPTAINDGRADTNVNLTTTTPYQRYTWQATDLSYSIIQFARITNTYSGLSPNTYSVTIESSANGTTWTSRGSLTNVDAVSQRRWMAYTTSGSSDSYYRVTIQNTGSNTVYVAGIELLTYRAGDQGGPTQGIEANLPFSWDSNRRITMSPTSQSSACLYVNPMLQQTATLSNAVGSGTLVTYTTTTPHNFVTGQTVTVTGTNGGLYDQATALAITVTGYTTFTVSAANTGTWTSGGTVTMQGSGDSARFYHQNGTQYSGFDSASKLTIRTSGTQYSAASVSINTAADGAAGIVVRGNSATQSSPLQLWQDNNGNNSTRIVPSGNIVAVEPKTTQTTVGATVTADTSLTTTFLYTLTTGTTTAITLSNLPYTGSITLTFIITQPATGTAGAITWPTGTKWSGGAPTLSGLGKTDIVTLVVNRTNNATDTIYGFLSGKDFQ